jgi:nucleoside-diphosphate-sugar epimerase
VELSEVRASALQREHLDQLVVMGQGTQAFAHEVRGPLNNIGVGVQFLATRISGDNLLAEKLAADPSLAGQAFNFSNEEAITVLDLAGRVLKAMGSNLVPKVLNQANNEIREQRLSSAKARNVLGWKPLFELDRGLANTIAWYRRFFSEAQP